MTVKVTKPEVNIRDRLSELDKPTGVAGAQILKSDTPQEVFNYLGAGRRNLIINGGFDIWQRGESTSNGATGYGVENTSNGYKYVTADHIQTYFVNAYSKQTAILPSGENVNVFRETLKGQRPFFVTIIENAGRIFRRGGPITVSFWARGSKDHALNNGFYFYDNWSSTSYYRMSGSRHYTQITTEWKYHTFTFELDENIQNHQHLAIEWDNVTEGPLLGTDEWREFAQIQVEAGSVATPFDRRPVGEELALCQRYYETTVYPYGIQTFSSSLNYYENILYRQTTSTNDVMQPWHFKVTKRIDPSFTIFRPSDGVAGYVYVNTSGTTSSASVANAIGGPNNMGYINTGPSITTGATVYYAAAAYAEL
jgi:hypothetical protein